MSSAELIVRDPLPEDRIEVAVGIPSFREADNIAFVVEQAAQGLKEHFGDRPTAVINADNCSDDGTKEAFLGADSCGIPRIYLSTPQGVRGKGNNFQNLFRFLLPYQPSAVVVVDADLKSIRPHWIQALADPILDGYAFVSPYYSRNEYDGTITNHLCYPLLYGVLGRNLRQPIGGDFAFSTKLMKHWLGGRWTEGIRSYGIDIFMTVEALAAGFPAAQAALGCKVHKPSAPKLGSMFTQVADTLFGKLLEHEDRWRLNGSRLETPPLLSGREFNAHQAQELSVDYKSLKRQASEEFERSAPHIREILSDDLYQDIRTMFDRNRLAIRHLNWARVVYSFLRSYRLAASAKRRLAVVEALKPLYFARVVSFIRETLELDHADSEDRILRQARTFWRYRKELLDGCGLRAPHLSVPAARAGAG
jgi:glucosylglycerate synthase